MLFEGIFVASDMRGTFIPSSALMESSTVCWPGFNPSATESLSTVEAGEPAGAGPGEPAGAGQGEPAGAGPGEPAGAGPGEPAGARAYSQLKWRELDEEGEAERTVAIGETAGEPAGAVVPSRRN